MAKIIFRSVEYKDKIVAVSIYSPEFRHGCYSGQFQLSPEAWEQLRGCIQVGYEDNPVGLALELYHGTQDNPPAFPADG